MRTNTDTAPSQSATFNQAATIHNMDEAKAINIIKNCLSDTYSTSWKSHDELCALFATHPSIKVQEAILTYPKCPSKVLLQALESDDMYVRGFVASSAAAATGIILMKTIRDESYWVRKHTAQNPLAPENVLLIPFEGEDKLVAKFATQNPHATYKVLLTALKYDDFDVQYSAASHPNASECVLLEALDNPHDKIKIAAIKNQGNMVTKTILEKAYSLNNEAVNKALAEAHPTFWKHRSGQFNYSGDERTLLTGYYGLNLTPNLG